MSSRILHTTLVMGSLAACGPALAQQPAADAQGTATVTVETAPPGAPGTFIFTGVPTGTIVAGGSTAASGLAPGSYTTVESGAPPGLVLVAIVCADGNSATPSVGDIQSRTATFNIDRAENVTCVFSYRSAELAGDESGPGQPGAPGTPGAPGAPPAAPEEPGQPALAGGPEPCTPPDIVPREGRWNVSNKLGSMVCGTMINMPLKPSTESGIIEVEDCGWTVHGKGLAADTAPITMRAVDKSSGTYTGSVGGAQDGIPMTIHFTFRMQSEERILGDLHSEVTQQGMTCRMERPFELRYAGQ